MRIFGGRSALRLAKNVATYPFKQVALCCQFGKIIPVYANLLGALAQKGIAHYRAAAASGISPARFSRGLHGLVMFTSSERERIAAFLGYPEEWLFEEIRPPRRSGGMGQATQVAEAKK